MCVLRNCKMDGTNPEVEYMICSNRSTTGYNFQHPQRERGVTRGVRQRQVRHMRSVTHTSSSWLAHATQTFFLFSLQNVVVV